MKRYFGGVWRRLILTETGAVGPGLLTFAWDQVTFFRCMPGLFGQGMVELALADHSSRLFMVTGWRKVAGAALSVGFSIHTRPSYPDFVVLARRREDIVWTTENLSGRP